MNQLVYKSSLRFTRIFFAIILLAAYLIQGQFIVFAVGITLAMAALSAEYNVVYHFHVLSLRKYLKKKDRQEKMDAVKLALAWKIESGLLLIATLLFILNKLNGFGWFLVLADIVILLLSEPASAWRKKFRKQNSPG